MSFRHRIRTIYAKELIDILRDRRTLIAMIVVPIVLYPLLMLGSLQAVSIQAESMEDEALIVGVLGQAEAQTVQQMIVADARLLPTESEAAGNDGEEPPTSLEHFEVRAFLTRTQLEDAVRNRGVHVGVIMPGERLVLHTSRTNEIELLPDLESVRSGFAVNRVREMLRRVADRIVAGRKARLGLPAAFDEPIAVTVTDLSTPSSILGQVLPLILILMTITGAIYPAIDLTAGERERGTLESLMVCPVPVIDLIVGKFLVVTTVAIMGATLNLASVTATVFYGGFDKVIAGGGGGLPFGTMLLILLCLIPFAVLMSAVMIAVCSYARTFKEAQNYVTPVILAVLIPGGIAALPATRLEGIMLVMPVGNMVLLARDFLLGAFVPWPAIATVLLATTLYAAAAVAVAASVFGQESVVFADAGSLKSAFTRRTIKPSDRPGVSMGLLLVALLFPVWFFVQASLSTEGEGGTADLLYGTAWLMPLLFVALPLAILLYWKVSPRQAFALRMPSIGHLAAGVLIGLSAWVPSRELHILQASIVGTPRALMEQSGMIAEALQAMPMAMVFLVLAIVPAFSEELLFRGFLLSSLGGRGRKWTAIVVSAAVFGVFHFLLFKFLVTACLGVVLAYLCWQSRSIVPGFIAHCLHNGIGAYSAVNADFYRWLNIDPEAEWAHLPPTVLIVGTGVFLLGLTLTARKA